MHSSSVSAPVGAGLSSARGGGGVFAKIWFTLLVLVVCRLGTYIPIPGINPDLISTVISKNITGIMGVFNLFSGGALGRMTIFALNVMPYIVSSIVVQLLSVTFKSIDDLRRSGEAGRRRVNSYTRYMTVVFAVLQATVILVGLEEMNSSDAVLLERGFIFRLVGVFSLLGGTLLLVWLGDMINARGVGNGISLIIFSGIVSEFPGSFASLFVFGKNGVLSIFSLLAIIVSFFLLLFLIVCVERSFRRVLVQYPKRQLKNRVYAAHSTYIPLKINMSGVIPPIFANALLLSPITIASFNRGTVWADFILNHFSAGKFLYIACYVSLVIFFCFFYTTFVFNSKETADTLRKNGGVVLNKRPGKATSDYLDYVVLRLSTLGAAYLSFVCVVPELVRYCYDIPFNFGGTSLLIIVNVIVDTLTQVQTCMFAGQYDSLIKKSKLRKKL